jgi:hypothetical protein
VTTAGIDIGTLIARDADSLRVRAGLDMTLNFYRRRVTHQNVANCITTLAEPISSNSTLNT